MPRGLNNWTYKDVTSFLKKKGFSFYEQRSGSHEALISADGKNVVEINFHGNNTTFPIRTLETMIRQSDIPKKEWREWAQR